MASRLWIEFRQKPKKAFSQFSFLYLFKYLIFQNSRKWLITALLKNRHGKIGCRLRNRLLFDIVNTKTAFPAGRGSAGRSQP